MEQGKPNFQANCKTTAMSIMPHADIDRAIELALSLDIPFWPQLPNVSFYEDMYAQAAYDFPGIVVNPDEEKISFNTDKFEEELNDYSQKLEQPESFALSGKYGRAYHHFLDKDLWSYPAIRGQVCGPINLGFRINDEDSKPIIYNDSIRGLLFDFIQKKFNIQYRQLKEKNQNAFVWVDEPGLIWVFSGLSGYNDIQARQEYQGFLSGLEGLKALHLCTNINLSYLLTLGINFLSFDAYQIETIPKYYARNIADFTLNGGIISWGIVPTEPVGLAKETPETLANLLLGYWEIVSQHTNLPTRQIAEQALVAPAKCCVKSLEFSARSSTAACNIEASHDITVEEQSVERAYLYLRTLSEILRDKFDL